MRVLLLLFEVIHGEVLCNLNAVLVTLGVIAPTQARMPSSYPSPWKKNLWASVLGERLLFCYFLHLKEISQPIQGDTDLMTVTKMSWYFLYLLPQPMTWTVLLSWASRKISPNDSFLMVSHMEIEFTSLFCAWPLHKHSDFKGSNFASSWPFPMTYSTYGILMYLDFTITHQTWVLLYKIAL